MSEAIPILAFLSDNEGLADAGNGADITVSWISDDGSPANGCLEFAFSGAMTNEIEYARNPSTGATWENWGVLPGATVTNVQVSAYNRMFSENNKVSLCTLKMRIIDSVGDSVTDDTQADLISEDIGVDSFAWGAGSAGSSIAVNADRQDSSTDVRFEIEMEQSASGGNNSYVRIDTIEITITYTGGGIANQVATVIISG